MFHSGGIFTNTSSIFKTLSKNEPFIFPPTASGTIRHHRIFQIYLIYKKILS